MARRPWIRKVQALPEGELRWVRLFSHEKDVQAHLIGSEWLTRTACRPGLVNSRLAEAPGNLKRCHYCESVEQRLGGLERQAA